MTEVTVRVDLPAEEAAKAVEAALRLFVKGTSRKFGYAVEGEPEREQGGDVERRSDECRHFGGELSPAQRAERGLGHGKRWSLCLHPEKPHGEVVCPCKGCNQRCSGYEVGG